MAGNVYCFNTIVDPTIYKVGHTQQETVAARLRGYLGPAKPRVVIATRCVDDSERAEAILLHLLRHSTVLTQLTDLGNEWFRISVEPIDCHNYVCFAMDLVQDAVRKVHPIPRPVNRTIKKKINVLLAETKKNQLPNMTSYYKALDKYISVGATASVLEKGLQFAVETFEKSDNCPVLADYLLAPQSLREAVARNRYPHLEH